MYKNSKCLMWQI